MPSKDLYGVLKDVSEQLYVMALKNVPTDVLSALKSAYEKESGIGKMILDTILKNIEVAKQNDIIVCQDTGTPIYYVEAGAEMSINIKKLYNSIYAGTSSATHKYDLRPNMLDPITRELRGDNVGKGIPVLHLDYNDELGSSLRVVCVPKGSGSENQSFLRMLSPAEGIKGVVDFVLESIVAGANKSCAPVIVGVGIGGTFDECAWLAKKAATIRKLNVPNPDKKLRILEEKLLMAINDMGIGPMGLGGKFTALAVNIEVADTHISQLPVAVNLQCWKGQRAEAVISDSLEVNYTV